MTTLAATSFGTVALVILFLIVSLALIGIVLIQRPSGGGLSGAFGSGSGSGQTAFGTKTGDALTIITVCFFVVWLGLAMGLNWATKPPKPTLQPTAQPTDQGADPKADQSGDQADDQAGDQAGDQASDQAGGQDQSQPSPGDVDQTPAPGETPDEPTTDTPPAGSEPTTPDPAGADPGATEPAGTEPAGTEPPAPAGPGGGL